MWANATARETQADFRGAGALIGCRSARQPAFTQALGQPIAIAVKFAINDGRGIGLLGEGDMPMNRSGGPDRTRICDLYRVKVAL